mgnify:CR=1 FL=1
MSDDKPMPPSVTRDMIAAALSTWLKLPGRHPLETFSARLIDDMRAALWSAVTAYREERAALHAALAAATPEEQTR